jgi:DNA-binding phage protein
MQKYLDSDKKIVDFDTGEIEKVAIIVPRKKQSPFKKSYHMTSQNFERSIGQALLNKTITGADMGVLMIALSRMDMENYVFLNQSQIARDCGMKRQNISRSINKAVKLGLLLKGDKMGALQSYRFNAHWVWKGKSENHTAQISQFPKPNLNKANPERCDKTEDLFD